MSTAGELKFYDFHHHHYSAVPDDTDSVEAPVTCCSTRTRTWSPRSASS